nr:ABC transporter ATP-binding protein [Sedimentibacter sp.]
MEDLLNITNLKTHFFTKRGVVPAVDGISISIPKSSIVGVVGESGCGKSMTAMSIMQLVQKPGKVVQGTIELEGDNMLKYSKEQMFNVRGNKISMIFQEPMTALNPVYTVGKQVTEAITIHHKNISKSEAKQRVVDIFRSVGIPEPEKRFNSYPHQLSGGLRQRVMIGMAMVCNPKLMIADEPTTALDVTIEAQILMLMKKLQKERDTSILLITHNLGVVAEICDYVYVMYAGKVMEQANTFELFKNTSHPYTDGLMKSIPKITAEKQRLYNIKGIVPNLMKLPEGCRFCPRCEKAMPRCFEEEPQLYKMASDDNNLGDHYVRCFLHENREVKENERP